MTSVNNPNGSALQYLFLNWPSKELKGNDALFLEKMDDSCNYSRNSSLFFIDL